MHLSSIWQCNIESGMYWQATMEQISHDLYDGAQRQYNENQTYQKVFNQFRLCASLSVCVVCSSWTYSQTRLVSQRLMSHSAYCHRIFHPRPAPILNTDSVLRLLSLRLISQNG